MEQGSKLEIEEYDTAEEALGEFLGRMVYWRTPQDLADSIVDELPWNGYHIVKMTDEEKQKLIREYEVWFKEEFGEEYWENGIPADID